MTTRNGGAVVVLACLAVVIAGCSGGGSKMGTGDGGVTADAGGSGTDGGSSPDSGRGGVDAGSTDAGSMDAGSTDAGSTDAGSTDAGSTATGVPSTQQGSKLVGTAASDPANQGYSVALSADGNTALIGASRDNANVGAAWVFTRSGSTWSQQGPKLVGTGASGAAQQGYSVALSGDGNTALIGGYTDNTNVGAAWVFRRSGTAWSQQGSKLVGTGAIGAAQQGWSVAMSADGNTALIGGYTDDTYHGATWVFTRSGSTWSQQGSKLVGTGAIGFTYQGYSVALSADGNTALIGGYRDDSDVDPDLGAAWVFTRSGGAWSQQGPKLRGTGASDPANQGYSVALSGDGNTALIAGYVDNHGVGAVWVFARSGGAWSQQGSKLVATGSSGMANQGASVALSGDGNTALIGGPSDNGFTGATWVFARSGSTWSQHGSKLVGTGGVGSTEQGTSVALSADGNTALIGGPGDNHGSGAVWVFMPNCAI